MIFAEPDLERLILFKVCSEMEGSGLRLETQNGLHDEAVGVSEWMLLVYQNILWEN